MKITKVLSNLITEDARFQVLYKKYVLPSGDRKKGILPFEVVRDIIFADPTTRPQDYDVDTATVENMTSDQVKVGKYVQWMLKRFVTPKLSTEDGEPIEVGTEEYKTEAVKYRRIFLEDLPQMKSLLAKYDRFKGSLVDADKKNIDNVASLEELYQLPVRVGDSTVELGRYEGKKFKKEEGKEVNQQYDIPGAEILKVGSEYTLIRIADKGTLGSKAAAFFGGTSEGDVNNGETNWCTRVEGHHSQDYRNQSPLYIIIANDGSKGVGQITGLPSDRYQLHFGSRTGWQFKNQDQYGANGNIPIAEWLRDGGKFSEFREILKPEFANGFVLPNTTDVVIKYPSGNIDKYVAIYGLNEIFETLPENMTKLTISNESKENITIDIPESISKYKSITAIMLKNVVSKIPDSICELKKLRLLALPNNPELKTIPECILNIPSIQFVSLNGSDNVKVPEGFLPFKEQEGGNWYHISE
jgi:hypothetical protein